jgi:hypothetical protein
MDTNENLTSETETEIVTETSQEAAQESETPTQEEIDYKAEYEKARQEAEDYKAKFGASTRENQIIRSRETDTRKEPNEPTEAELRKAFPQFDYMSDEGKELARFNFRTQREAQATRQALERREAEDKWNRTLEQTVISNPALDGKERAFKEFANKPQYRGASVELLVDAFLHKNGSSEVVRREPQPGLETGSGGPKEIATKKGLNATELKNLRENDEKAYREYVLKNPIDLD